MGLILLTILLLASVISPITEAKNAGVLTFVSSDGLDDVVKSVANYYSSELLHSIYHFQDIGGPFMLYIWKWSWKLSNIQIQKVSKPYAKAWTTKNKAHLILTDLAMDLTGDFVAKDIEYRLLVESSKLSAHACFHIEATFSIGPNSTINVDECYSSFQCQTDITLDFDYDDLLFYVQDEVEKQMAKHIDPSMLCKSLSNFTVTDSKVYTVIRDPHTAIDLTVKDLVEISDAGITAALAGEVFDYLKEPLGDNNPMVAPQLPFNMTFNKNKMTTFVLSEYFVNTVVLTGIEIGLADMAINTASLPPENRTFFSTNCIDVCIGKDIPQISKMFPKQFVLFRMEAKRNINSTINENGITVATSLEGTFYIKNTTFFTIHMDVQVTALVGMTPGTVLVTAKLLKLRQSNVTLVSSNVGHISTSILEMIADQIKNAYILPQLTMCFKEGIDMGMFMWIPSRDEQTRQVVHFIDAYIQLHQGMIVVSADFTLKINAIGLHNEISNSESNYTNTGTTQRNEAKNSTDKDLWSLKSLLNRFSFQ